MHIRLSLSLCLYLFICTEIQESNEELTTKRKRERERANGGEILTYSNLLAKCPDGLTKHFEKRRVASGRQVKDAGVKTLAKPHGDWCSGFGVALSSGPINHISGAGGCDSDAVRGSGDGMDMLPCFFAYSRCFCCFLASHLS